MPRSRLKSAGASGSGIDRSIGLLLAGVALLGVCILTLLGAETANARRRLDHVTTRMSSAVSPDIGD